MLTVTPTGEACGAVIEGVDISAPQPAETIAAIRRAWLDHHVVIFPDQKLDDDQFERFVTSFGPPGDDPFFDPIDNHARIAAIWRKPDETGKLFADTWHSDWSFQVTPPSGSCLYGIIIPPEGGDTLFTNQHKALDEMPSGMRSRIEGLTALHSPAGAYATDGAYSPDNYKGAMSIRTSEEARVVYTHPLVRNHPETGRPGLFAGSYVFGFEGMDRAEGAALVEELTEWQTRPEFVYRHKWEANMLVMWDNRSVLHCATGGYEGHERLLHRLTIADDRAFHLGT